MKIIEVIPSFEPLGGAENFVFHLSLSLRSRAEVCVISLYDDVNAYVTDRLHENGIEIIYLHKKKGIDLKCGKLFRDTVNREKPDAVHLHMNSYLAALAPMLLRKCAFVYTFHTFIAQASYGNKNSPSNLLLRFLIGRHYMEAVTISDTVDDSYRKFFGGLESRIIYNGIDISRFRYQPQKPKKYDFISVGSIDDIKNNLFMIRAVEELIAKGFHVNYVVLGHGKNYEACRRYCREHHLDDSIRLVGQVNNVEEYMAESKCLLMASLWEGNPLVVNEAIASGTWVIANDVGGIKDLLDETCGYLTVPENEGDFLEKMISYLNNADEIANRIIPENIEKNRKKVDLSNSGRQYLELMNEMIRGDA